MEKVFSFDFNDGAGHMDINVGEFFASSNTTNIKKLLRLIAQNCEPEQLNDLLECLREGLKIRKDVIKKLSELIQQLNDLLTPLVGYNASALCGKKAALEKQCEKIRKYMEILDQNKG